MYRDPEVASISNRGQQFRSGRYGRDRENDVKVEHMVVDTVDDNVEITMMQCCMTESLCRYFELTHIVSNVVMKR
jgi:hypothetical protein